MKNRTVTYCILILLIVTIISCDDKGKMRVYHELNDNLEETRSPKDPEVPLKASMQSDDPNIQKALKDSVVKTDIKWQTPEGWVEKKGSGMRVASLTAPSVSSSMECSIVSLAGNAGGEQANLMRWMRQIDINLTSKELLNFVKTQEKITSKGGYEVTIYDFSKLQINQSPETPSMMATILSLEQKSIFIKMKGTKSDMSVFKNSFRKLCQSIK